MEKKMHAGAIKHLYQRARELRNNSTQAEVILWSYLRSKPLGIKFRRQHPYAIYILDFFSYSLKLVIEVDGSIHDLEDVKRNDIERQKKLEFDGLLVKRFTNDEITRTPEKVFEEINMLIQKIADDKKR